MTADSADGQQFGSVEEMQDFRIVAIGRAGVKKKMIKAVGSGQWAVGSGQWAVGSGQ
jgi:hypothetical protein